MTPFAQLPFDLVSDAPQGAYLVGGAVRDGLMGQHPSDLDLVVAGDIHRTARRIANRTGGRIVDLGKKGFSVLRIASPEGALDITPLSDGSIEEDLRQRDFTINAMAYDLVRRRVVDCAGGRADLARKRIRMVSPEAFQKDPARLVRAYRMAATLDFSITEGTRKAISRDRHLVTTVAGERIWSELVKIFRLAGSAPAILAMAESRLLTAIFPELSPTVGCVQNRYHAYDVFTHSLLTYEQVEALLAGTDTCFADLVPMCGLDPAMAHKAMVKYGALLHDVGKPATRIVDAAGGIRFPGHGARGAAIAAMASRRLRLSNRQFEVADNIIRHHIRPLSLYQAQRNRTLTRRGMVRFFSHVGPMTLPIVVHAMADHLAKQKVARPGTDPFLLFCRRLARTYKEVIGRGADVPPLINGKDLISRFGLRPSPRFKTILKRVDELRLSGELDTREAALRWVQDHLGKRD